MTHPDYPHLRAELASAVGIDLVVGRLLAVAGVLEELLADLDVHPVVVGGLAFQYWAVGGEEATDLDVLMPADARIDARLQELGFVKTGRHWHLPDTDVLIEAPGSYPSDRDRVVTVDSPLGKPVRVLSPADVLVDRLHQFLSTGASDAALQAVALLGVEELERDHLVERAEAEDLSGALEQVELLAERIRNGESVESDELHEIARRARRESKLDQR